MKRDWSEMRAKVAGASCRVCGSTPVDPAHIVPRSRVTHGGEDARNAVALCRFHHRAYDTGSLDLLPVLSREEQAYAVLLVGLAEAYQRTTNTRTVAA